jgi:ABC-type phosphate/phosphonate transport system permease subunit
MDSWRHGTSMPGKAYASWLNRRHRTVAEAQAGHGATHLHLSACSPSLCALTQNDKSNTMLQK